MDSIKTKINIMLDNKEYGKIHGYLNNNNPDIFNVLCLFIITSLNKRGQYGDECQKLIKDIYESFEKKYEYNYNDKSYYHTQWGQLCLKGEKCDDALNHAQEAVRFSFANNTGYKDFDFFSFRTCSDFTIKDIQNKTVSLSPSCYFNDPVDTPIFQWLDYLISASESNVAINKWYKMIRKVLQNIKVRCFVRNSSLLINDQSNGKQQCIEDVNSLMWAHYADSHKGLCIKYKFNGREFTTDLKKDFICGMFPMKYIGKFKVTKSSHKLQDVLFSKSKIWKYENECRLFYFSIHDEEFNNIKISEAEISAIYLGLRCSLADEQRVRLAIRNKNVPLFRMKIDEEDIFRLKAVEI